jgi:plastocyanin
MLKLLRRHRRVLVLLALTLVLAAFTSASALASGPKSVKVKDDVFSVKTLHINKGTKVKWNWVGVLRHNVTVRSGPSKFSSPTQVSGSYSHRFTKKGTYKLYCTLHTFMTMTVVVK